MRTNIFVALAVTFWTSLAVAAQDAQTVDVFAWPLSAEKSQTLAKVSYTSTNATVKSYTPPKVPSEEEIVRVGFYHPSGSWSGVATAASNLEASKNKRVQLHLNTNGQLYHVGFRATDGPSDGKAGKGKDELSVEVVNMQRGPTPHLNKPVVTNADGTVPEKEAEKTFLQKYWYFIVGFVILQVVLGGAGKE